MNDQPELFNFRPDDFVRRRQRRRGRPMLSERGYNLRSLAAADEHAEVLSRRKGLIREWLKVHGPSTDREIRDGINPGWDMNAIRPRVNELRDEDHLVVEVGEKLDPTTRVPVRIVAAV